MPTGKVLFISAQNSDRMHAASLLPEEKRRLYPSGWWVRSVKMEIHFYSEFMLSVCVAALTLLYKTSSQSVWTNVEFNYVQTDITHFCATNVIYIHIYIYMIIYNHHIAPVKLHRIITPSNSAIENCHPQEI